MLDQFQISSLKNKESDSDRTALLLKLLFIQFHPQVSNFRFKQLM